MTICVVILTISDGYLGKVSIFDCLHRADMRGIPTHLVVLCLNNPPSCDVMIVSFSHRSVLLGAGVVPSQTDSILAHGVAGPHVSLLFGADLPGPAVTASSARAWEQVLERPNTHPLGQS